MILPICIAILAVALLMARVAYTLGVRDTHHLVDGMRVRNIKNCQKAWRAGVRAERMRAEIADPEFQAVNNFKIEEQNRN